MSSRLHIALYGDGQPVAVPCTFEFDLKPLQDHAFRLADPTSTALDWWVSIFPQAMSPLAEMVQERMMGALWRPIMVRVEDPSRCLVGDVTPGMLYTGVSDCPSVTYIPSFPYVPRDGSTWQPPLAYSLHLAVRS